MPNECKSPETYFFVFRDGTALLKINLAKIVYTFKSLWPETTSFNALFVHGLRTCKCKAEIFRFKQIDFSGHIPFNLISLQEDNDFH